MEIVNEAYLAREPGFAAGYYRTPGITRLEDGQGMALHYCHGRRESEVEVIWLYREHRLRTDILHDAYDSLAAGRSRGRRHC